MEALQATFYILGIIFMILSLGILIAMVIAMFYVKAQITKIHNTINEKIDAVRMAATDPGQIARGVGAAAASALSFGMKQFFKRK